MDESTGNTDSTPSELSGVDKFPRGFHPASRANLTPPWLSGQSGNPSGLTRDGKPTRSVRRILDDRLQEDEQRSLKQLVNNWLKHANRGSAKHLEMILERIDPMELGAGKVILEGLKLLTPGGASVTIARQSGPLAPRESDANSARGDSYEGVPQAGIPLLEPPSQLPTEENPA